MADNFVAERSPTSPKGPSDIETQEGKIRSWFTRLMEAVSRFVLQGLSSPLRLITASQNPRVSPPPKAPPDERCLEGAPTLDATTVFPLHKVYLFCLQGGRRRSSEIGPHGERCYQELPPHRICWMSIKDPGCCRGYSMRARFETFALKVDKRKRPSDGKRHGK